MWLARVREGVWDLESSECACDDAIAWEQTNSRRYVLSSIYDLMIVFSLVWGGKAVAKRRFGLGWGKLVVHLLVGLHSVRLVFLALTLSRRFSPTPPTPFFHAWGSEDFVVGFSRVLAYL